MPKPIPAHRSSPFHSRHRARVAAITKPGARVDRFLIDAARHLLAGSQQHLENPPPGENP